MEHELSDVDFGHFQRAIELALLAEAEGNLPIGCVITYGGKPVAEGRNAIWEPELNPMRHAEMEALKRLPRTYLQDPGKLTLYSTLEPCMMCTASILQHGVGRVLFGASDEWGGSGIILGRMPPYYEEQFAAVVWLGPLLPEKCDPLFHRVGEIIARRK
jgi:tRNA(adenine34) deaminase